jgi:hypothetical protein
LALAGCREDTSADGFWAGNIQRINIYCVVVSEERHCGGGYRRGVAASGRRKREGACLACASARLHVSSSAAKPSAEGSALPKKDQGRRRFVSSVT